MEEGEGSPSAYEKEQYQEVIAELREYVKELESKVEGLQGERVITNPTSTTTTTSTTNL